MERKKRFTQDELETIWLRLKGQLVDQGDVPDLFAEGMPCDVLYGRVYDARERLSRRTGIDFEDHDLMEMIHCLEEIGMRCGFALYEYTLGQ